ncbi:MAG: hypothetical protein H0X00_21450, partial [Sporichthya sp.]|nr:hypothetical protein [Sporichthya sp.]
GGPNRGFGGADRGGLGGPGAENGSRGSGGIGAATLSAPGAGGGGGGGYFGGGGGGSSVPTEAVMRASDVKVISGGAGGGSGFVASAGPGVRLSKASVGAGSISGPGDIEISYPAPAADDADTASPARGDRKVSARRTARRRPARSGTPSRGR